MKTGLKIIALAALVAALASATLSQSQPDSAQSPGARKTFALIVGISKYPKLPGGQQLQFADRDATLFAEAMKKSGVRPENIRILTGAEATVSAIKAALGNWIARLATEEDTVLFFFSGHGVHENEFNQSYLLGYDSDAKDPFSTALSTDDITQALTRRIRSRHVLILADSMRKDFFDPEVIGSAAASFVRSFNQIAASREGVSVIMANGPGEFSREGQRWGAQGVFARHIVDVLSGGSDRNGDGQVTADELFEIASAKIAEDTSNKQHIWRSETALAQIALSAGNHQNASVSIARAEPARPLAASETPAVKPVETVIAPSKQNPVSGPSNQPVASARTEVKPPANKSAAAAKSADPLTVSPPASITPVFVEKAPAATTSNPSKQPSGAEPVSTRAEHSVTSVTPSAGPAGANTKPASVRAPAPPNSSKVTSAPSAPEIAVIATTSATNTASPPAPPRPEVNLPTMNPVGAGAEKNKTATVVASVPASRPEAAPTPLILELEAAIVAKNLVEPKNASAWDFYQRLSAEPSAAADLARLKPALAAALADYGRAIVSGDVCADNVADRVDDFKRAGQVLARARALKPDGSDIAALEKLSAAQALIALQFYDEAERTLMALQGAKLAAVENSLGLVYQGKLDSWRAERAYKRAAELDSKWATPHYNLALLYRSQQNDASLSELESAASLDATNPNIFAAIGDDYFSKQQWQRAADAFKKAIALRPLDESLRTKLGHSLYSQGSLEEANREYQKARELRSKRP